MARIVISFGKFALRFHLGEFETPSANWEFAKEKL